MAYYEDPQYIFEDGCLTIPRDSIKTICGMRVFSYFIIKNGEKKVMVDNPTDIRFMLRPTLEELLFIRSNVFYITINCLYIFTHTIYNGSCWGSWFNDTSI